MDERATAGVDRLGLEILTTDECWHLLRAAPVGRVAFVADGEPVVFPVTFAVEEHHLVFRSGTGTKLEAAKMARSIAFEIDAWDAVNKRGWSVLASGVAEIVYDDEEISGFESLGFEPWLDAAQQGTWVRIRVHEVSGRRLQG